MASFKLCAYASLDWFKAYHFMVYMHMTNGWILKTLSLK